MLRFAQQDLGLLPASSLLAMYILMSVSMS